MELKEFITNVLGESEKILSKKGYKTCSKKDAEIKMELYANVTEEVGGGLKIHFLNAGAKKADTNTQKITICAKKIPKIWVC